MNHTRQICRKLTRDNINILTCPTHEAFETGLTRTGYEFYAALHPSVKTWDEKYRPKPSNYHLINYIPPYMDIDVALSQNKFGQFQIIAPIAMQNKIPLISLEHTLPPPNWGYAIREQVKMLRGDLNVFISDFSVEQWGFSHNDPTVKVVKHGIDTKVFNNKQPVYHPATLEVINRQNKILTVANDFINRDWCLNYSQFCEVTKGLEPTVVGATPGLSEPASDIYDLVRQYKTHRIYLNTAHVSPIPTSLLEAMACGCAVVSCKTAAIPDYVEHGVNGFLAETTEQMKEYIKQLMNDEALATELGDNAAKTIQDKYNIDIFANNWKKVIEELV
jgi:hypothetical protein